MIYCIMSAFIKNGEFFVNLKIYIYIKKIPVITFLEHNFRDFFYFPHSLTITTQPLSKYIINEFGFYFTLNFALACFDETKKIRVFHSSFASSLCGDGNAFSKLLTFSATA